MSFTNKTPNYGLPQYIGSDIPSYLVDFNGAMSNIDTALAENKSETDHATSDAASATTVADNANTLATNNATEITKLDTRVTNLEAGGGGGGASEEELNEVKATANTALTTANEAKTEAASAATTAETAKTTADNALSTADNNATEIDSLGSRVEALEDAPAASQKIMVIGGSSAIKDYVGKKICFALWKPAQGVSSDFEFNCSMLFQYDTGIPCNMFIMHLSVSFMQSQLALVTVPKLPRQCKVLLEASSSSEYYLPLNPSYVYEIGTVIGFFVLPSGVEAGKVQYEYSCRAYLAYFATGIATGWCVVLDETIVTQTTFRCELHIPLITTISNVI